MYNPPVRGRTYIFYVCLVDQTNTKLFKSNPTLAAGDVKISKDGGATANLNTLPTVTPASGVRVKVTVSDAEMDADNISITFQDAAGAEWCDLHIDITPNASICAGTVTTGGTTTSVPTSSFSPGGANAADQFNGRVLIFDLNTTTVKLRGQGGPISANTSGSTPTFTLSNALTDAPANTDTFKIY